jgi:hypothetical protein
MNDEDLIEALKTALESLFPKNCTKCGRRFSTFKEFLLTTAHLGEPIFYDAVNSNNVHCPPYGIVAMFNCNCNTTLAVRINKLCPVPLNILLRWINSEAKRQGVSVEHIMAQIRVKVDNKVLADTGPVKNNM